MKSNCATLSAATIAASLLISSKTSAQQVVDVATDFSCPGLTVELNAIAGSCLSLPSTAPAIYPLDYANPVHYTITAGQQLYRIDFKLNGTSFFAWTCSIVFPQPLDQTSASVNCDGQSVRVNVQGGPSSPSGYVFRCTTIP